MKDATGEGSKPNPADRRKVLIELDMKAVALDVFPLYAGLATAVQAHLDTLTAAHLKRIAKFLTDAVALSQEDLEQLAG